MKFAQSADSMEGGQGALNEDEEEEEEEEERNGAAFHPSPPASELFDMPSTVDPSYVISLIRKLLPTSAKNEHLLHEEDGCSNQDGTGSFVSDSRIDKLSNDETETVNNVNNAHDGLAHHNERGDDSEHHVTWGCEEAWEENGCILWDLAANKTHAELMVENLLFDVLLPSLIFSQSVRIREISLGILANLACHEVPRKCIISAKGLVNAVVNQLFSDDSPCLCEAFRLLTLCLQCGGSSSVVETLQQEHILERILWITENTLNSQLLEKGLGLLLVIIDKQVVAQALLSPMEKLGLVRLLINLMSCEMEKLSNQRIPERFSVLDMILQVIEALSVTENYSQAISSSKELLQLTFELVKLPDKIEVSSSCVTAVVLIANMMTDVPDIAAEVSQDLSLLQALLDIIPFVSGDMEARCALWSVLGRLFVQVLDDATSSLMLHRYVSVLIDKSDFIEVDLVDHQVEDSSKDQTSCSTKTKELVTVTASLSRMQKIFDKWTNQKESTAENNATGEDRPDDGEVSRLLRLCCKYIK